MDFIAVFKAAKDATATTLSNSDYNVNHLHYKNKAHRNNAKIAIVNQFEMPGFHLEEFCVKMKSLQGRFYQEYTKVKEAIKSGNIHTPKLVWYPMMYSMNDSSNWPVISRVVGNVSEHVNIIKEQVIEEEGEQFSFKFDLDTEGLSNELQYESKIEGSANDYAQLLTKLAKLSHKPIKEKAEKKSDEHVAFGTYVASILKNLKKQDAQIEIHAILLRYRLSNLETDRLLPVF